MSKPKNEHATAEKILQAAQDVFMAKGFEGSSINDIANKAKINKSLIYHHFSSKIDLWKAVKKYLLEKHMGEDIFQIEFPMDSFRSFLKSFVSLRFKFYDDNPTIVRLISWQRLENAQDNLGGIQETKFNSVTNQIKEFQQRGDIRPELDPEMVNYFIMKAASMAFMERPEFFDDESNKQKFLDLVIESLFLAFSTSPIMSEQHSAPILGYCKQTL